ncbi:MAG TPA: DUF4160 domain-containing protein [Bacteroidia bacterium]|nr:DUF4160 domain-containing protein [Bacteroidia bacterium]
MPKIYEYFGIIFLFYANDHLPIHVHAQYQEYETKFEFNYVNGKLKELKAKKVKGRLPLPSAKMKEAILFIKKYHSGISEKWTRFFVWKSKVKSEKITKRIK